MTNLGGAGKKQVLRFAQMTISWTMTKLSDAAALALVEQVDRFQDRIANDFEALGAELVHGVLRGVMEDVVVAVVEVDDVGAGDAAFYEGQVIVFDGALAGVEVGLVTLALGGGVNQIKQPRRTVGVAVDIE